MNSKLLAPLIPVFGSKRPAYQVCGIIGYLAAALQGTLMVSHHGLSQWVWAGIALTAAGTFFVLAMLTKITIGQERLIYYHHEIAVVGTASLLLWLLGQPFFPWLDITVLGVGLFLAFGRVGCLLAGCCHGRPHRFGITYGNEHVKAGFTPYLAGIRLFPVQAVESVSAFIIVGGGVTLVLTDSLPGEAFAWYVAAYGAVRFFLEFMRGDSFRFHALGFSEAQWTSLALIGLLVWAENSGPIPHHGWHTVALICIIATMVILSFLRRFQMSDKYRLMHPNHVQELADSIEAASTIFFTPDNHLDKSCGANCIAVGSTSLGIRISTDIFRRGRSFIRLYTISNDNGSMNEEKACLISNLILKLRKLSGSGELIKGNRGVFHLLVTQPRPQNSNFIPLRDVKNALTG